MAANWDYFKTSLNIYMILINSDSDLIRIADWIILNNNGNSIWIEAPWSRLCRPYCVIYMIIDLFKKEKSFFASCDWKKVKEGEGALPNSYIRQTFNLTASWHGQDVDAIWKSFQLLMAQLQQGSHIHLQKLQLLNTLLKNNQNLAKKGTLEYDSSLNTINGSF